MSELSAVDSLVQRLLDGTAPRSLRTAAARGALPLPRAVLARLFLRLRDDADESVRTEAASSLAAIEADAIREIVSDSSCAAEVLRHFAHAAARDEALAEKIAFHPAAPDEALGVLAAEGNASVLDLVLTNQNRLLGSPGLLDRLSANPALRPDQRGRLLDLLAQFFKDGEAPAVGTALGGAAEAGIEGVDEEQAARLLQVDVGELFAASEILGGEEFLKADDPEIRNLYKRILSLNTGQKAMLAMKGGREERSILIRDTNKVVALGVLKNPRLTEQEVERMAAMRNVSEEVLRSIGAGREWSKSYIVAVTLVRNPRTPPGVSTNFIPRMTDRDLKGLANDKNVPEIVRRNAKRTYETRNQKANEHKLRK